MIYLDVMIRDACAIQSTAEMRAFDGMAEDNMQIPFFLLNRNRHQKSRKIAVAVIAACLLFTTAACAIWPTVSVQILNGKAYLMSDDADGAGATFRKFIFTSLPADCEAHWNQTEGYYSCTVQKGGECFTVVQYPLEHRTQIIGDNADGTITQNDLEGIEQDFCTVSNVEELTDEMLETYSVVSWATDNCYFVILNDNWTDYTSMKLILQNIQS